MSSHTPPSDETQASVHDTAKIKILKFIVIALGVLMVVAFLTVVGTIAYRIMTKGETPDQKIAPVPAATISKADIDVVRPIGGRLMSMEVEGQMVYLLFSHEAGGDTILVLDEGSGQVVRRITVK